MIGRCGKILVTKRFTIPQIKKLVQDVLRELHNGVSGEHLGVRRALVKVRGRFY